MIKATVGDLLDGKLDKRIEGVLADFAKGKIEDLPIYRLYVVRDGETVFYVGQAGDVCDRLNTHIGRGSWSWARGLSSLGELIKVNLPASRSWQIDLYTVGDCAALVKKCFPIFKQVGATADVGFAERALIARFNPCLNVTYNKHRRELPERYKDPPKFGKLDLETTVSDFIPFE